MIKDNGNFHLAGYKDLGVLILHGLTGQIDEMRELARFLHDLGYSILIPQYRGHGTHSSEFLNTGVDMWYEDAKNGFEELSSHVSGVYVMGLSMGGSFSVKIAQSYPVKGLVTMNAPLVGLPLKEEFDVLNEANDDLEYIEKFQHYRTMYNRFITEIGQIQNLNKITAPLLVIQSELDTERYKISASMLKQYSSSAYKSRLDFKKSGHVIVLEEERYEMYDVIKDFLCEIEKIFK